MTPQLPIARLNWYHCHLSLRVDRTILFGVCERERDSLGICQDFKERERTFLGLPLELEAIK